MYHSNPRVKHQIPSTKFQISSNDQIPKLETAFLGHSELKIWIYLGFGICNLGFSSPWRELEMKRKYWLLLIICFCVLTADQWTKYRVQQQLPLYHGIEVIRGFFDLTHVRNTGGAFGIFGGQRGGFGSFLFVAVSLIAIGVILYLFSKVKENEKTLALSFSLVLSGAIGNLVDRLRYGEVIDFFDFHLRSYHWPAFNIADAAICVGIGLMALELLIKDHRKR